MKNVIILVISIILLSNFTFCTKSLPTEDRSMNSNKLIGRWKEYPVIALLYDSLGVFIDSIDISAEYEFLEDGSYKCDDDFLVPSTYGIWSLDSTETILHLYLDSISSSSATSHASAVDLWYIHKLLLHEMDLDHLHKSVINNDTTTIAQSRSFYKIK